MSCDSDKTITEIKRGSTFEQSLIFTDENDDVVNIEGWIVESDLKESPEDDLLLSFAIDDSQFSSGIVTISATPTETQALPADYLLQYDLKLTVPASGATTNTVTECSFWDESEIWETGSVWQVSPYWEETGVWDETEEWSCITTEEEVPIQGSGKIYYTETIYLKTSRHITD